MTDITKIKDRQIYCLECRTFTPNYETITVKEKDRMVQKAKCGVCGKKKNRFIKMIKVVNNEPIEYDS